MNSAVYSGHRSSWASGVGHSQFVGKRNKYREVPLNATARAALQVYLDTLAPDTLYLFPSHRTLGPLTERSLGLVVQKYAARAGVVDVSPHDLRHRFGYRMAERVPLHRLAQIMGHELADTTLLYIAVRNAISSEKWRRSPGREHEEQPARGGAGTRFVLCSAVSWLTPPNSYFYTYLGVTPSMANASKPTVYLRQRQNATRLRRRSERMASCC